MTREERLEFCKVCTNRKLDWNIGLVCKLTERVADFEGECESYVQDKEEVEYVAQRQQAVDESQIGDPKDFKKNKGRGGLIFWIGTLVTAVSFMGAQMEGGGFVILPLGLTIYGGLMYLRGSKQEKEFNEQNSSK